MDTFPKIPSKYHVNSGRQQKYHLSEIRYLSQAPFLVLPASSRSETLGCNSIDILDIPKPIPNHVRSFEMCLSFFFPNTELVSNLIFKLLHPIFYKCLLNCPPQLRVRGARLPLLRLRWHRHLSVRGHHALCRPFRQYFFVVEECFIQ